MVISGLRRRGDRDKQAAFSPTIGKSGKRVESWKSRVNTVNKICEIHKELVEMGESFNIEVSRGI